jgi:hypothetical protein
MGFHRRHWPLAALWVLAWVTRLPQLVRSPFLPDGDEALLGVMARHMASGEGWSLFLWGQRYALAGVEGGIVAVLFRLIGESHAALRCGPLLLWSSGLVLMTAALRRIAGDRAAFLAGALLLTCPGWMAIAVRAWATFCPGFFFASLSLWGMSCAVDETITPRGRSMAAATAGVSIVLAGFSHPLWAASVAPVLLAYSWRRCRARDVAALLGAGLVLALPHTVVAARSYLYWQPSLFRAPALLRALALLPARWVTAHAGVYFLMRATPLPPVTRVLAPIWALATAAAIVAMTLTPFRGRSAALLLGLPAPLLLALASDPGEFGLRYLLPAVTFGIIVLGVVAARSPVLRWAMVPLVCAGLWSSIEFRDVSPRAGYDPLHQLDTTASMKALLASLDAHGIRAVYSRDGMLQWNLMFESGGRVTSRWRDARDRYPAFPHAVDCRLASGQPVAIAGHSGHVLDERAKPVQSFGNFFVVFDQSVEELQAERFEITPCADDRTAAGG